MSSLGYDIVEYIMKISGTKKFMQLDEKEMRKGLEKKENKISHTPSKNMRKKYEIIKKKIESQVYYVVSPKCEKETNVILFLHGGAYIKEMNSFYWDVVSRLEKELKATIYIPIYPLAPKNNYEKTMQMLSELYKKMLEIHKNENITVIGDSAGGQIALSFCMQNQQLELEQPKDLILVSPVLSCFLTEEEKEKMQKIETLDVVLSPKMYETCFKWWANNAERNNYLVNPMQGEFKGLPRTTLFSGSHDILSVFIDSFLEKAKKNRLAVNYIKGEGMMHIWPYIPNIKECKEAYDQIVEIIRRN
jgi:acetyl esterase/lipase